MPMKPQHKLTMTGLILVITVVIAIGVVITTGSGERSKGAVITTDSDDGSSRILSIAEAGAEIGQGLGNLTNAPVDTPFAFADIKRIGLDYFMRVNGIPRDRGAEELLDLRVSTGLYSGARDGSGDWEFFDRPVWTVVVHDLPYSIPCGTKPVCEEPPGRFTVVIDALTGEVISSELWGGGPRSDNWDGIDLSSPPDSNHPTATPPPLPTPAPVLKQ